MINKLFSLPSEPAEESGRLVTLPPPTVHLPREKPVPVAKPKTKWEIFAASKGLKKRKRQDKIWDEEKQQWLYKWGKDRANNAMDQWAIDHNENDDSLVDPWTRMRQEKKARVEKNKKQQEANIRMATTGSRKGGLNSLDLSSVVGQEKPGKRNAKHKSKKEKSHLDVALAVAQTSTNSMGKFDVKRKGEPTIKAPKKKSNIASLQTYSNEKSQSANVLKKVLGKVKEKDAVNVDRAMHSIKAMDMQAGEFKTAKGQLAKKQLKAKLQAAKTKKGSSKPSSKGGKGGKKPTNKKK